MSRTKLASFFMVPVFAMGCAASADGESPSQSDADLTASAGIDFTAAVGAVEIGGRQVCTAALVDLDAGAAIGAVSLSGRQVVLGGACLGAFSNGYVGGAVFVTHQGSLTLTSPIAAVDLSSSASAGFGVGILGAPIPGVRPLKPFVGVTGGAHVGAATILKADENGIKVGTKVQASIGVGFELATRCTDWQWRSELSVGAGAAVSVGDVTGAAALVEVGGELQFAASIDGNCVARTIVRTLRLPLDAAEAVVEGIADIGSGKTIATYELADDTTVRIRFYAAASELRINAVGNVRAKAKGVSCGALLGACVLRPAGGFAKGETVDVSLDLALDLGALFTHETDVLFSVPE